MYRFQYLVNRASCRTLLCLLTLFSCIMPRLNGDDGVPPAQVHSGYVLGPGDQVSVTVTELPEFGGRSYRIDDDGTLSLPLLGRVQAGGQTLAQFEAQLNTALQALVRTPHVTANLTEARPQPVSVMGEVNSPGVQQVQGSKTLFDVIAAAGGLKTDAGDEITITRHDPEGPLNIPGERRDPSGDRSTAIVKVHDVTELRDPKSNILIRPHDEVSVSRAPLLYVIGNVRKPGGFTLRQGQPISALEAISMAEGLAPNANAGNARILRRESEQSPREPIPVDLKKIMAGKGKDVPLYPDDVLFVPDDTTRRVTTRVLEVSLATLSGLVIWRGL